MSGIFFETEETNAVNPAHVSIGPTTGFIDNAIAAFYAGRAIDQSNSRELMLDEARDERRLALETATGRSYGDLTQEFVREQQLNRPVDSRSLFEQIADIPAMLADVWRTTPERAEDRMVEQITRRHLQRGEGSGIFTGRRLEERARELAQEREAELNDVQARTRDQGLRSFAGVLSGGIASSLTDPVQQASLLIGAPARAGIVAAMGIEAAIGGGTSLAMSPVVQQWRKELELESGLKPALQDAGVDALASAAFTGFFGLAGKALDKARSVSQLRQAYIETVGTDTPEKRAVIAALDAEIDLARSIESDGVPDEVRHQQLAEVETALREGDPLPRFQADAEAAAGDTVPERAADELDPLTPQTRQAAEDQAGADPVVPRAGVIDDETTPIVDMSDVERQIARDLAERKPDNPRPQTGGIIAFLARAGGIVRDDGGELAARNLVGRIVRGQVLVRRPAEISTAARQGGAAVPKTLDQAREVAAEAGYFNSKYGDAETAMERSTPDDLLELIDEEIAGRPVFIDSDDGGLARQWAEYDDQIAELKTSLDEVLERTARDFADMFPEDRGIDPPDLGIRQRTVEIMLERDLDTIDAFDIAIMEDYAAGGGRAGDLRDDNGNVMEVDFYNDEDLARTIAGDGQEPAAPGGSRPDDAGARGPGQEDPEPVEGVGRDETDPSPRLDADGAGMPPRAAAEAVPEPRDFSELEAGLSDVESDLRAQVDADPDLTFMDEAGEVRPVADVLDELDEDAEFIAQMEVCLK